jgi:hypothetical protein
MQKFSVIVVFFNKLGSRVEMAHYIEQKSDLFIA